MITVLTICLNKCFLKLLNIQMLPPRVTTYIDEVLSCAPIAGSSYPPDHIIAGWTAART